MFVDRDAQGRVRGCKPANDADVDVDGQQITNVIIASICVSAWRIDGLVMRVCATIADVRIVRH